MKEAHRVDKIGGRKYELYTRYRAEKGKSRKLIVVEYPEEMFIITGA